MGSGRFTASWRNPPRWRPSWRPLWLPGEQQGAEVDAVDRFGQTCRFHAKVNDDASGGADRVELALSIDTDPTLADNRGLTVLGYLLESLAATCRSGGTLARDPTPTMMALAHATAWRRRRHLLLAVRGRYAEAADAGRGAAATSAAVADSGGEAAAAAAGAGGGIRGTAAAGTAC